MSISAVLRFIALHLYLQCYLLFYTYIITSFFSYLILLGYIHLEKTLLSYKQLYLDQIKALQLLLEVGALKLLIFVRTCIVACHRAYNAKEHDQCLHQPRHINVLNCLLYFYGRVISLNYNDLTLFL